MQTRRILGASGALFAAALAQAAPDNAIKLGDGNAYVAPALTVEVGHDDNVLRSPTNERSSMITRIANEVALRTLRDGIELGVSYSGEYQQHRDSKEDDYDDHAARAEVAYEGSRSRFEVYGEVSRSTQPRGTGISDGLDDATLRQRFPDPVELERWDVGAAVRLGADDARARLTLRYADGERKFRNFREITRPRDRREQRLAAELRYAVTDKTDARVDLSEEVRDYDFTPPDSLARDSTEQRAVVGLSWQASALTQLTLLGGWKDKDFDDPGRGDVEGLTWEARLVWDPRPWSRVELFTLNEFAETDTLGNTRDITRSGVSWTHEWTHSFSTQAALSHIRDDFEGIQRTDDFVDVRLEAAYQFLRWATLSAGVQLTSRDSDQATAEFERNVVFLSLLLQPDFSER